MKRSWRVPPNMPGGQSGFTLIELLVAAVISVISIAAMVILMAGTLGAARQTIEQSRMSQEMRTGMQIVTRELRRANFHADFLQCYGNVGCLSAIQTVDSNSNPVTVDISSYVQEIQLSNGGACAVFWYDRPQGCDTTNQTNCNNQGYIAGLQKFITQDGAAGFRRDTGPNPAGITVGTLQMWVNTASNPNCNIDTGWVDITDPNFVDVTAFTVSDANSYCENFGTGGNASQTVERIGVTLTARPVCDASVVDYLETSNCAGAERTMTDFIYVRNNFTEASACP